MPPDEPVEPPVEPPALPVELPPVVAPDEPAFPPEVELEGELEPEPALFWPACHSSRVSLPSWSLSSLSNWSPLALEDALPPEAALRFDEAAPDADEPDDDGVLLCDAEG